MCRVKICGITNFEDASFALQKGADALGFIFCKRSPRSISPLTARKIIAKLGPFMLSVGVFMDEARERVTEIARSVGLDALQFHGRETPRYCSFFRGSFRVIKVFSPDDLAAIDAITKYKVDAYMFDVPYEEKLQGKKAIDCKQLKRIKELKKHGVPVIVSGGLSVSNVFSVVKKLSPYAVDVASGLETLAGVKDKKLVAQFIKRAKDADS